LSKQSGHFLVAVFLFAASLIQLRPFADTLMEMNMKTYIVRKIGLNRGLPRVYLDVKSLCDSGFEPGKTYVRQINREKMRLTLTIQANGSHVVSKKDVKGSIVPIIDINSSEALSMFEGLSVVRIVVAENVIHILPVASEVKRQKRLTDLKANLDKGVATTAGFSFGGGVLDHAAHAGLQAAGIGAELKLANEIDEDLLNHAMEHNDIWRSDTIAIAAPMQELCADDAAMQRLPTVNVLAAGIPCSGASRAGKSKRKLAIMEDHPLVGHLITSAIMLINRLQRLSL
jgi:DNA (cytosine-5)-methyltransferase 1